MYKTDLPTRSELPSTGQLLRSTAIALITAAVLLITVILPSEYAIDPTGVGRVLGLTEMGEIKEQLAEDAARDAERAAIVTVPVDAAPVEAADAPVVIEEEPPVSAWSDEVSVQLRPGEAAEIKLVMLSGGLVEFEWGAEPGHLNSALHGDGVSGEAISYRNGRAEASHADTLTAAFDGSHGWFWRNRSNEVVTMTLRVRGDYTEIKRVL